MDFIINFLKAQGIKLFNDYSLKDSSLTGHQVIREEGTESEKFYYSQDVLDDHHKLESSNDISFLKKVIKHNQSIPDQLQRINFSKTIEVKDPGKSRITSSFKNSSFDINLNHGSVTLNPDHMVQHSKEHLEKTNRVEESTVIFDPQPL